MSGIEFGPLSIGIQFILEVFKMKILKKITLILIFFIFNYINLLSVEINSIEDISEIPTNDDVYSNIAFANNGLYYFSRKAFYFYDLNSQKEQEIFKLKDINVNVSYTDINENKTEKVVDNFDANPFYNGQVIANNKGNQLAISIDGEMENFGRCQMILIYDIANNTLSNGLNFKEEKYTYRPIRNQSQYEEATGIKWGDYRLYSWNSNDSKVVFSAMGPNFENGMLAVLDVKTGDYKIIDNKITNCAAVKRFKNEVAYLGMTDNKGGYTLFMADIDSGAQIPVPMDVHDIGNDLMWSPDDVELYLIYLDKIKHIDFKNNKVSMVYDGKVETNEKLKYIKVYNREVETVEKLKYIQKKGQQSNTFKSVINFDSLTWPNDEYIYFVLNHMIFRMKVKID